MIGAFLIFAIGIDPIKAYANLLDGAFGSVYGLTETIVKFVPLTLTGLAVAITYKSGFFNIGGEGQFYIGALLCAAVALSAGDLPFLVVLPAVLLAGLLGGGLAIVLPALLKAKFEVNEIFSTFMLNFVAIYLVSYLISGPMKEPEALSGRTALISPSAWLPRAIPGTRLHAGVLVALLSAFLLYFIMNSTTLGYGIRAVGASSKAARYAGMNVPRTLIAAAVIGGALAGLAGAVEVAGIYHRLANEISPFPIGYGYLGIWVGLVGRMNALGVLVSSFLFSFMMVGGQAMTLRLGVPVGMVYVIQGLIVIFVIGSQFFARGRT